MDRSPLWWIPRPVIMAAVLLIPLTGCSPPPEISERAELLFSSETPQPTTTFELRFEDRVAQAASIGRPTAVSPLIIEPPWPGQFTWLSERSGVFTPSEPPRLGTDYRLTLRADVARGARLRRTFRTPAFGVTRVSPSDFSSYTLPCEPEIQIWFNADVRPHQAGTFLEFRDATGLRIPAEVRQGVAFGFSPRRGHNGADADASWRERFMAAQPAEAGAAARSPFRVASTNGGPVDNLLVVTPLRSLPVGAGWRLVLRRGAPGLEAGLQLPADVTVPLGDIRPFRVVDALTQNGTHSGKRIQLNFSRALAPEITPTNVLDWIDIAPVPRGFSAELWQATLALHGEFDVHRPYTVRVKTGLPSHEPTLRLAEGFQTNLVFTPVPPRLYFPGFAADQLATGSRQFELLAVNAGPVTLRAKQLNEHTLIHALRGYSRYFRQGPEPYDFTEPYREVDYEVVPGQTVYRRLIYPSARTDDAERFQLGWDDILGPRKFGAVFLEAEQHLASGSKRQRQGAQALVQVTDLGLAWKFSSDELVALIFSHSTGRPVPGAVVRLLTDESEPLVDARTGADGLARLWPVRRAAWLMAQSGDDLHAVSLTHDDLPLYGFHVPLTWDGDTGLKRRVMLFTDRGVYRPGETAHIKAIRRDLTPEGLELPPAQSVTLRCFNARNDPFYETNLEFSALGSLAHDLVLPAGMHGSYRVELWRAQEPWSTHSFQVQDFQPDAFEIALTARPAYHADEKLELPLSARYLFGQPLSRAQIHWAAEVSDARFAPAGLTGFHFCTGMLPAELGRGPAETVLEDTGPFTNLCVLAPAVLPNPQAPQPRRVLLSLEVTDLNQQTVTHQVEFLRHSSAFYLGWQRPHTTPRAGEPIPMNWIATGPDGTPLARSIAATVTVQRVEWNVVRVLGAGHVVGYRSERSLSNVFTQVVATRLLERVNQEWRLSPAPASSASFTPSEAGTYLVEGQTLDEAGRPVLTADLIDVAGPDAVTWNYRDAVRVELVPDRTSYHPGETASVLVKTPISGTAMVTVEREHVRRSFVTEVRGPAATVQVPLDRADAPNVFVSVLIVRGSEQSPRAFKIPESRLGYAELIVKDPLSDLRVSVQPDAAAHRPGEGVQVAVELTDSLAQAVAGAEVTLYAVDEGVLGLTGYVTPDPRAVFFAPRPLAVRCGLSLNRLLPEDPDARTFGNKGYLVGGGGREKVRKHFLATALWLADLRTGGDGRVTARFQAPDSLTRYRLIAVAHTAANQFGSGEAGLEINKPLMIEASLPPGATVGDRLTARAVVHNLTQGPREREVEVSLQLDAHATMPGVTTRRLRVPSHGSTNVDFPVELATMGSARWIWRAHFTDGEALPAAERRFTDAVESTLPIHPPAPLLREVHLARVDTEERDLLTGVNPQLREADGTITVRVSNTRLTELAEASAQLLQYPYGCVEQTTSRLIPWLVMRRWPVLMPPSVTNRIVPDRALASGLTQLLSMQTSRGGLGYWPGARDPSLWGSAYGGLALALARREGLTVPARPFTNLLRYLQEQVRHPTGDRPDNPRIMSDQCLALYTLAVAGAADPSAIERLQRRRSLLSGEDTALLALAMAEGGARADACEEWLRLRPARARDLGDGFGSDARALAIRLLAWSRVHADDPAVDPLVLELMHAAKQSHWTTTQGNAWALLAFAEYATKVEANQPAAAGKLRFGSQMFPFEIPSGPGSVTCVFSNSAVLAQMPLLVLNADRRRLFTQVTLEGLPRVTDQPRQDRGFDLTRHYARLNEQGEESTTDAWRVGDRVLVTLRLNVGEAARYVAIDDPLPAVLEAVQPEFKTQQAGTRGPAAGEWFSSFRELRADRALFFRDHLPPGAYEIRYVARVRAAGDVTAPSAKVEEMYHPERLGLSGTLHVHSIPLP